MTKKICFSILLCSFLFTSCKNEGDANTKQKVKEDNVEVFQFVVDIKTKDSTDLILYYKDGTNEWIVEDKAIWNTVPGESGFQKVVFNFDEGVIPNDFRFDIGRNEFKNNQPIEIKKIILNYQGRSFEIEQDKINYFFKPNQHMVYDAETKQYALKKDDNGNYDPYLETAAPIYPQIANLVLNKTE